EQLDTYLKTIKAYFGAYPDSGEITADMESRIAEQFNTSKKHGTEKIITSSDVSDLIRIMGQVEDFESENATIKTTTAVPAGKKFFRNPDDTIIAGVASGLSAYFGIDTLVIRLIFVLSLFMGGFGVILYLVLWLAVPEATTATEKMQMRGDPINLSALEQSVKQKINNIKNNPKLGGVIRTPGNWIRTIFNGAGKLIRVLVPTFGKFIGVFIALMAISGLAFFTFLMAILVFNVNSPYIEFPLSEITSMGKYYLVLLSSYLGVVIPLVFLVLLAVSLIRAKNLFNYSVGFGLFGLWFLALITTTVMGIKLAPAYEKYVDDLAQQPEYQIATKTFDIADFNEIEISQAVKVTFIQDENYSITTSATLKNLETVAVSQEGSLVKIGREFTQDEPFCLICWDPALNRLVQVVITAPDLNKVIARHSSDFTSENLNLDELEIVTNGAADINLNLTVKKLIMSVEDSADITLRGLADEVISEFAGNADLIASDFVVKNMSLKIADSADARINITENLKVTATGSAEVVYIGNPQLQYDLNDASTLRKMGETPIRSHRFNPEDPQQVPPAR
ncbi:MAG TPA: DUF2807 domain-containing protein, partial [Coxiellaceae bacterium]|nr:DUF2807 domain-containing protein [Coxiellaceae bacterium]